MMTEKERIHWKVDTLSEVDSRLIMKEDLLCTVLIEDEQNAAFDAYWRASLFLHDRMSNPSSS